MDRAERFVNRSPQWKRIEAERRELLEAITQAQLVLSIHRLPDKTKRDSKTYQP